MDEHKVPLTSITAYLYLVSGKIHLLSLEHSFPGEETRNPILGATVIFYFFRPQKHFAASQGSPLLLHDSECSELRNTVNIPWRSLSHGGKGLSSFCTFLVAGHYPHFPMWELGPWNMEFQMPWTSCVSYCLSSQGEGLDLVFTEQRLPWLSPGTPQGPSPHWLAAGAL